MRIYRALLRMCRALLQICRALLRIHMALSTDLCPRFLSTSSWLQLYNDICFWNLFCVCIQCVRAWPMICASPPFSTPWWLWVRIDWIFFVWVRAFPIICAPPATKRDMYIYKRAQQIHMRALHIYKRALHIYKEPYIFTKEPDTSTKEPYIHFLCASIPDDLCSTLPVCCSTLVGACWCDCFIYF